MMLTATHPLPAFYDFFDDEIAQPEVEAAADPSIQAKFAMALIMAGTNAKLYALGGFYDNADMQAMASSNIEILTSTSTDIFRYSQGDEWVNHLNQLIEDWWRSVRAFADSKTSRDEEEAAKEMFNKLCRTQMLFNETFENHGKDEIVLDEQVVAALNQLIQHLIVKGRQGELTQTDPALLLNNVNYVAQFAAKLVTLPK